MTVNKVLLGFEKHTQLGPTFACQLLGVAYPTYAQVRSGSRPLQKYTQRHIEALMLLPPETLQSLIQEHVRDGWQSAH